jgi:hypothetical protein
MNIMKVIAIRSFKSEIARLNAQLTTADCEAVKTRLRAEIDNYKALIAQYSSGIDEPPVRDDDTPVIGLPANWRKAS